MVLPLWCTTTVRPFVTIKYLFVSSSLLLVLWSPITRVVTVPTAPQRQDASLVVATNCIYEKGVVRPIGVVEDIANFQTGEIFPMGEIPRGFASFHTLKHPQGRVLLFAKWLEQRFHSSALRLGEDKTFGLPLAPLAVSRVYPSVTEIWPNYHHPCLFFPYGSFGLGAAGH